MGGRRQHMCVALSLAPAHNRHALEGESTLAAHVELSQPELLQDVFQSRSRVSVLSDALRGEASCSQALGGAAGAAAASSVKPQ